MWAFKLGGRTGGRRPGVTGTSLTGAYDQRSDDVDAGAERGVWCRYAVAEHAFNPPQIRVRAGAIVTFVNSGGLTHTIASKDATWTTGTLPEAESGFVRFDTLGTFTYECGEHPWVMGRVFVAP